MEETDKQESRGQAGRAEQRRGQAKEKQRAGTRQLRTIHSPGARMQA